MRRLIAKFMINTAILYLAAYSLPTITVQGPSSLIWAGLALTIVNLFIRPLVLLLTLPLSLLTLNLFTLITNTWMLMLADTFSPGIKILGFGTAFLTALAITLAQSILLPKLTGATDY